MAKTLAGKGWLTLAWPTEYGGQDRPMMEQVVYQEEMAYNLVPPATLDMGVGGIGWVGPTLMIYGTDEQKKEHIPYIGAGERFWCTGYSEPDSGSDLASPPNRGSLRRRPLRRKRSKDMEQRWARDGLLLARGAHRSLRRRST